MRKSSSDSVPLTSISYFQTLPGTGPGEGWCLIKHRLGWANNSRALLDFLTSSLWSAQLSWCSPPGWTHTHSQTSETTSGCVGYLTAWSFHLPTKEEDQEDHDKPEGERPWVLGLKVQGLPALVILSVPLLAPNLPDWSLWRGWWKWGAGQWAVQLRPGDRF